MMGSDISHRAERRAALASRLRAGCLLMLLLLGSEISAAKRLEEKPRLGTRRERRREKARSEELAAHDAEESSSSGRGRCQRRGAFSRVGDALPACGLRLQEAVPCYGAVQGPSVEAGIWGGPRLTEAWISVQGIRWL